MSEKPALGHRTKTVLLFSGGIDSTVLLYDLLFDNDVLALMVDYGQPHKRELKAAEAICSNLHVPDILIKAGTHRLGQTIGGLIFPNRNAVLVSLAGAVAESSGFDRVAFAAHGGDRELFPDCRAEWVAAMDTVLQLGTEGRVGLAAPYLAWSKADIVARGRALGVPFDETWSCYAGGASPCGICLACTSRAEALA